MSLPLTLQERIIQAVNELDDQERQLPEPLQALVIFTKLREPDLYKRVRFAIRDGV